MQIRPLNALFVVGFAIGLLGCSTVDSSGQKYSVSTDGYASVKKAPASPDPLTETDPVSQSLWYSPQSLFARQNNQEAKALEAQLRAKEAENFVEFRLSQEPELHYQFSFLDNAETTLAKYTSNPIFKPNMVKHSAATLEAKSEEINAALLALYPEHNLESTSSVDIPKGKVVVYLSLYEEDFDGFPTLDVFRDDPLVELNYNGPLDPAEVLSTDVMPLIRHIAHGPIREPMVITGGVQEGIIRLKDGCFVLDAETGKDKLLVFAKRVGVTLDDEGYIALIDRSPNHPGGLRTTRVGEAARWFSGPDAVTDPEILTPLQAACGPHEAVVIGAPHPL